MKTFGVVDPLTKLIGDWLADISCIWTILIRVALALLCAGTIGIERARKKHAAGFRTYMLVCLGAAIVMMVNQFLWQSSDGTGDTARLGAQVISGIGFLGAGSILITSRNQVKGLTTAAGLWTAACMGLAIGAGFYTLALITDVVIVLVLSFMPRIEQASRKKTMYFELYVELETRQNLKNLVNFLRAMDVQIDSIEKDPAYVDSGLSVYSLMLTTAKILDHDSFITTIQNLEYVNYCEEVNK